MNHATSATAKGFFSGLLESVWPTDQDHLPIRRVADWFASYVYLQRMRDDSVLQDALQKANERNDAGFGYASSFDERMGHYRDLKFRKVAMVILDSDGLLVRRTAFERQVAETESPVPAPGSVAPVSAVGGVDSPASAPSPVSAPPKPRLTQFYGTVEIDADRPMPAMQRFADAILAELGKPRGAKVTVMLDIQADAPGGFPDDVVSVVKDNARTLKFDQSGGFE